MFLALFISTFAQDNNLPCPSISVRASSAVVQPNETMTFSALIADEVKNYDVEYKWTIDKGAIVTGQGTTSIQVSAEGISGTVINATIEIKGLAENCNSKNSDAAVVAPIMEEQPYDEYEKLAIYDELAGFDGYISAINKNRSDYYGFVVIGIKEREISNLTKKRLQRLVKDLDSRKFARERIVFAVNKSSYDRIVFWIVPPDTKIPKCEDREILKASEIK